MVVTFHTTPNNLASEKRLYNILVETLDNHKPATSGDSRQPLNQPLIRTLLVTGYSKVMAGQYGHNFGDEIQS